MFEDLMTHWQNEIQILLVIIFFITSFIFLHGFNKPCERSRENRLAFSLFFLGSTIATLQMAWSLWSLHEEISTIFGMAVMVSWITILAYYVFKAQLVGIITSPIIVLFLVSNWFLSTVYEPSDRARLSSRLHIVFSLFGEALAIAAFALAILYLLQQKALKKKLLQRFSNASPSLEKLGKALTITLWAGFFFITLSLVSGAVTFIQGDQTKPGIMGKLIWALAVWLWYLIALASRTFLNSSLRRLSQLSMVGFVILALSFFGFIWWGGAT